MMEESRHCGVCKRVLERHGMRGSDKFLYKHAAIDEPADHPPVAVRDSDDPVQPNYRCDFCLDEPITHTMVIDGDLTVEEIGVTYDPEWAMCAMCAKLAMSDQWSLLTNRAFVGFENKFGHMTLLSRVIMARTYAELRDRLVMYYAEQF